MEQYRPSKVIYLVGNDQFHNNIYNINDLNQIRYDIESIIASILVDYPHVEIILGSHFLLGIKYHILIILLICKR